MEGLTLSSHEGLVLSLIVLGCEDVRGNRVFYEVRMERM